MSATPWKAQIITLFPEMFPGPLGASIIGRALEKDVWSLETFALRDFATDKHRTVDQPPFGGGAGMVMRPDVLDAALVELHKGKSAPDALIYFSPRGKPLQQVHVKQLAKAKKVAMVCTRFEGVDQRILEEWDFEEVSLGDFVLAGAEIAAMALIEACVRLLPGVVSTPDSLVEESFSSGVMRGLLEYPHYTRPRIWKGREVPEVLLSGDHAKIRNWRLEQAKTITKLRRPDLWQRYQDQLQQIKRSNGDGRSKG